jgi:hypothetical protein
MSSAPCSRIYTLSAFCGVLLAAGLVAPAVAAELSFKSGPVTLDRTAPAALEQVLRTADNRADAAATRVVVQFEAPLTATERADLAAAGVELLNYIGSGAYFAKVATAETAAPALAGASVRAVAPIQLEWKIAPELLRGDERPYAEVGTLRDGSKVVAAYVLFHRDVDLNRSGKSLALLHEAAVRDVLESVNGLVIELPEDQIPLLASEPEVMWIEPPLPQLSETNDSNRVVTQVDQAWVDYGLDGTGITVLVYDGGTARATHVDFEGRLTVGDDDGLSEHATHVSGTIGGGGVANPDLTGMAPGVNLLSYGFQWGGGGIFLYSNPGDMEEDYFDAISNRGADISNNSIGTNTAPNGFPCEITGDYGVTSQMIDTIVRGDTDNPLFTTPFRIVWANGNERQTDRCGNTFATTAPPATAKNHITVGALNSNDDSMTEFSSWGPTDDGRIKPDIAGPGCQSDGDGGVSSCAAYSDEAYTVACGTSMASPTVCGVLALVLEGYTIEFPDAPLPRNSTLKALLAHTAEDRGGPGPDYRYGYGSVRATAAIAEMRSGRFLEAALDQDMTWQRYVMVSPGDDELKITLAWDDYPAMPNVATALVNDLDLRVYSPSGERYFPWTLDGAQPSLAARQDAEDHINNIEQVLVADPEPGAWRIEVHGTNVPEGPQVFSLVGDASEPVSTAIVLLDSVPAELVPHVPVTFDVRIATVGEGYDPQSVTLHWRTDDGAYDAIPMTARGGNLYETNVVVTACDQTPEWYFSVEADESGLVQFPAAGADAPLVADVGISTTILVDDFEMDLGWTTEVLGATDGAWERAVPVSDFGSPFNPESDADGSGQCYLTANRTGNSDVDGGAVRLTSPAMDMARDGIMLQYAYYFYELGDSSQSDFLQIEISSNGLAGPWTEIALVQLSGGTNWHTTTMTQADLIAAGVTLTDDMRLRFTAADYDGASTVEAAVDAVLLSAFACDDNYVDCNGNNLPDYYDLAMGTSSDLNGNGVPDDCESLMTGDMNCDGVISAADIDAFVLALTGGEAGYQAAYPDCFFINADANGDSTVTAADIDGFVTLLTAP